jgi:predicted AAA+ superfamily ATPase
MLVGVRNYDRITFEQLIGYERQKEALIENTEFFLKGYPANNVLLHGDRGTGKSSCVKALLNKFKGSKLKLISLNKNHVDQLYRIIESIAGRGCKFIIFIDDLSFEDTEIGYKHFKSVIEGGIEAQPGNVLIYVTSNRRNIVREVWKDRGADGEVHLNDGMQERLSLADRFGLSISFTAPDKESYLNIVKGLAAQERLDLDEDTLIEEALKWDVRQKGRSGRSARQFVNHIYSKTLNSQT